MNLAANKLPNNNMDRKDPKKIPVPVEPIVGPMPGAPKVDLPVYGDQPKTLPIIESD